MRSNFLSLLYVIAQQMHTPSSNRIEKTTIIINSTYSVTIVFRHGISTPPLIFRRKDNTTRLTATMGKLYGFRSPQWRNSLITLILIQEQIWYICVLNKRIKDPSIFIIIYKNKTNSYCKNSCRTKTIKM